MWEIGLPEFVALSVGIAVPTTAFLVHRSFECRPEGKLPHRQHTYDEDSRGDLFCVQCDYVPRTINAGRAMIRELDNDED
jgi:hypothetical protein